MSAITTHKPLTLDDARARLEAMCARAERCTFELREKLWLWGIPAEQAAQIIEHLKKTRFVDDSRFARAFVNDKVKFARWGRIKIRRALTQKRIAADIIDTVLDEIDETIYRTNLDELLRAKAATIDEPRTFDGRTKLFRFALGRGFEPDLASASIKSSFA